jgi:polar amino acid transport system ATP-binding protein
MTTGDVTPMVRFEKVTKRYGNLTVIDGLDLSIGRGEKVAMIGPSGSGKTTVLRMLMTLERIDGGVIWVDGEMLTHVERNGVPVPADTAHLRRVRGKIGMVFQHFNLFPHMTALKNCMEAPVTVLGMSKREAEERAGDLLAMVGLADKRNHFPSQLSGGQQQRVAIARAIVSDPKLLLCDEPTGDLDRTTADEILSMLQALNRELGKTIVMVTHDPAAAKYAKRTLHLDKGHFVEKDMAA